MRLWRQRTVTLALRVHTYSVSLCLAFLHPDVEKEMAAAAAEKAAALHSPLFQ